MTEQNLRKNVESLEELAVAGFIASEFGKGGENIGYGDLFESAAKGEGQKFLQAMAKKSMDENGGQLIVDQKGDLEEAVNQYMRNLASMPIVEFSKYAGAKKIHESLIGKDDRGKMVSEVVKENKDASSLFQAYSSLKLEEASGKAISKSSGSFAKNLEETLSQMDGKNFKDVESKIPEAELELIAKRREVQLKILDGQTVKGLYSASVMGDSYGEKGKSAVVSDFLGSKWNDAFVEDFYLSSINGARAEGKSSVNLAANAKKFYGSAVQSVKVGDLLKKMKIKGDRLTDSQKDMYMFELQSENKELAGAITGSYISEIIASTTGYSISSQAKEKRTQYDKYFSSPKVAEEKAA